MIKKFRRITNLGVFGAFQWDQEVVNANGQPQCFQHINVIYGRNYSGKTTLSRLLRALETQFLSEKFEGREFEIVFDDGSVTTHENFNAYVGKIRVFNEDFVRDNLRFINNPDEAVEPFALIGDDNVAIQEQIEAIEAEIGSNEEGQETGLFAKLKLKRAAKTQATNSHQTAQNTLESQLRTKATAGNESIKYNSDKFGDQNYTISKLRNEIDQVLKEEFDPISDEKIASNEELLKEEVNDDVAALEYPSLSWDQLVTETEELVTKAVAQSDKIEELAAKAVLNRWVKEGRDHHRSKRKTCAFCGNEIQESRWEQLDKHFDEESEKLEEAIDQLLESIANEKVKLEGVFEIDEKTFYSKFRSRLTEIKEAHQEAVAKYSDSLEELAKQLQARKDDIIHSKDFQGQDDHCDLIRAALSDYETLRKEANEYSSSLGEDQATARTELRLKTVHEFAVNVNYSDQKAEIDRLATLQQEASDAASGVEQTISQKKQEIEVKRREMNDEEKGAIKVNEYLNDHFGHSFLTLEAQENQEDELGEISVRFVVMRDGEKAHHLSEGEISLLAFCYFMAKLDDVETRGTNPIIWIDDPISSLDSNHIFFIFSLIQTEIVLENRFEQLFVSTHNLDFLKYLKRLRGSFVNHHQNKQPYECRFFVVERHLRVSKIIVMPEYLREYVTEFNYLFHQIYLCSKIESVTDDNYSIIYNFGNNARKFLEIFLYYKYPHGSRDRSGEIHLESMRKFFEGHSIPTILTTRVSNEYSHLAGSFERGSTPVDASEIQEVARLMVERLRQDRDQYDAFLASIGEQPESEANEQETEAAGSATS
ncbi:AAA family ATPase [Roseibacillus ishigakijimensis]|uniref:AAA family ATPase n=1 Tax=Roseibacillus ishigakijimensis TaxID=454146 RepID=A0A934RJW9_9BACT|nr:AAA family ATPase [Roseibacillus ishigakijimensis]MBK1833047.1 AAA family ATPase [Roseibacillus ishigakijimensis]